MKPATRLIVAFAVRLAFVFFAGWVVFAPGALPEADMVTRIGLAAAFLIVSILVGEMTDLKTHFQMLVTALRAAGAEVRGAGGPAPASSADEAVPILIRALGTKDEAVRAKAHHNLRRITGQDLPADAAAWQAWWDAREAD